MPSPPTSPIRSPAGVPPLARYEPEPEPEPAESMSGDAAVPAADAARAREPVEGEGGGEQQQQQQQQQEEEEQGQEEEQGCVDKAIAVTMEYKETLSVLPIHWKIIWAIVLLLWVPIAYTVAAPVPGSMFLFLIAWTSFVLKHAGAGEGQDSDEDAVGSGDVEDTLPGHRQAGGGAPPGEWAPSGSSGSLQQQQQQQHDRSSNANYLTTRSGVRVTLGPMFEGQQSPEQAPEQPAWFEARSNPVFLAATYRGEAANPMADDGQVQQL